MTTEIDSIENELKNLLEDMIEIESEVSSKEDSIETGIKDINQKIDALEDDISPKIGTDKGKYVKHVRLYVQASQEVASQVRHEKEIQQLIEELDEEKREYQELINNIKNSETMPPEVKQEILDYASNMPIKNLLDSSSEDEKYENILEEQSRKQVDSLIEIGSNLQNIGRRSPSLKGESRQKVIDAQNYLEDIRQSIFS